jgi:hypothetical protein
MKKMGLNKICKIIMGLAFLAVVFQPGLSQALTSTGSASLTGLALTSDIALSWLDPTVVPPADTRGSFVGVTYGTDPVFLTDATDAIDGAPWGPLTVSVPGFGSASTTLDSVTAGTNITAGQALAQAVLSGQFFVTTPTTLSASAAYALAQTLLGVGGFAYNDVSVSLLLEDFDTGALIAQDQRFFAYNADGTYTSNGTLSLPSTLLPIGTYNFEAEASTFAQVPEPGSLILIGTGLLGLFAFRKKSSNIQVSAKQA